jgi:hypothetical protein
MGGQPESSGETNLAISIGYVEIMVPGRRLELPRPLSHWYLKPARLPFRHPGRVRADIYAGARVCQRRGTAAAPADAGSLLRGR